MLNAEIVQIKYTPNRRVCVYSVNRGCRVMIVVCLKNKWLIVGWNHLTKVFFRPAVDIAGLDLSYQDLCFLLYIHSTTKSI